ncbi:dihydrolipoyl dehydrogenase [Bifidobacterium callimiconis]|uniref:Dihydrolipoyl dehydrogenase n=1 Tax=Bifidobacterium callimiconis TaxID=2306973 RepID=A0A430FG46_9BIFI|nr:dihydrolipoyl dehydrogenase [Bifidobacterium callimiconis]MBT1176689.1 dihydrolipoyl dehydrogenase [Bifidobacterium callimiconis]RSX51854.1 dihydrolipoamide dehydrogenase [Bifidobacterium callimiconis]
MTAATEFDIVVIGAGPGGYSTALRAAELGLSVALVERDDRPGGTCLNRGCIPTKALITAARAVDQARAAERYGVTMSVQNVDFGRLAEYRDQTVRTMTEGLAGLLRFRKVVTIQGTATIESEQTGNDVRTVFVTLPDGSMRSITARHVVLATGSRPRPLPNVPFSQTVLDSDAALARNAFPSSAIIIGSGAIALEFASLWNAAGTQVTLLARRGGVLSHWDRRVSATLTRELKRHGVTVVTNTTVDSIETGVNLGATVRYTRTVAGKDQHDIAAAEVVLAAIGRDPNTDADWFAKAGIALDDSGFVRTDGLGRTSANGIWAVGDITAGHQLAHRAFEQGITVAEAIAGLDPTPVDEATVPSIVFSSPEAAAVGLTKAEAQARDDYSEVTETIYPMMGNARTMMIGENGSITVVSAVDATNGERVVVGIHMVGPEVSEIVAEAEQIVGGHLPLSAAARLIHPHPTFSEALGEALLKADGRPLHMR